jgi:hypothetical protein
MIYYKVRLTGHIAVAVNAELSGSFVGQQAPGKSQAFRVMYVPFREASIIRRPKIKSSVPV